MPDPLWSPLYLSSISVIAVIHSVNYSNTPKYELVKQTNHKVK